LSKQVGSEINNRQVVVTEEETSNSSPEILTLLRTKLYMPRLAADLIERPHLLAHLDRGLNRKLTLVSAPAGYGKTTLIVQWLRNRQSADPDFQNRFAWLSLDKQDDDLLRFLNYFAAAIQAIFPAACSQTANMDQLSYLPPLDFITTTLINELAELPEDFVMVLDDYYLITDGTINQILTELLVHLPLQMHLVIATRIEPPLPLAKLRVQQQLNEIRLTHLTFVVDEVQAYLAKTMRQTFSREVAALLRERTEGWGAGLRMAVLSMRGRSDPAAFVQGFEGSQHHVLAYLTDEVLAQQSPEVQEFLLQISILSRFSASLGAAVSGKSINRSREIIEQLEQSNLFIVPLDDKHGWFRYHHLFQEMLIQRLQAQLSEDEIMKLHNSASVWLAGQRSIEEALQHALAADNIARAAQLIEQSRHDFLNSEHWYALERLLNVLPAETESKYAGLLIARAWTLLMRLDLPSIPHLVEEAEHCLAQDSSMYGEAEQLSLAGEIDAIRGMWGSWQNMDINSIIKYCDRAKELIPSEHTFARGIAYGHLCNALQFVGQSKTAVRLLNEFITERPSSEHFSSSVWVSLLYGLFHSADLNQLQQMSRRLLKLGERHRRTLSIGFAHYFLGWASYSWNELDAAIDHFNVVAHLGYNAHLRALHDSMLGLALAYQAKGVPEHARDTGEAVLAFFLEADIPDFLMETYSFQARLAFLQGDIAAALHWAQTVNLDSVPRTHLSLEYPILNKARILVAHGTIASLKEATRLIQERLLDAEATHNTRRLIEILPLLAMAKEAQGQTTYALAALERVITLAQPGRAIRPFVDLGPPMARLLYHLADRMEDPTFISQILAAFSDTPAADMTGPIFRQTAQAKLVEPLSEREQEVLALLGERLSDKEISHLLNISSLTVRKHNQNIYQKLSVNTRKQAVARAKTLGLLQPD
jgi:LuxR family maltose regulon positive regulatory protein